MKRSDAVFLSVIYVLGILWIAVNSMFDWRFTVCPTKTLLGIPCPGCGTTRAAMMIIGGDLKGGIMMNPNIILIAAILVCAPFILWARLWLDKDYMKTVDHWLKKKAILYPLLAIELAIWIYNMARGI